MSVIERTTLLHDDGTEIESSDRRLFTIEELQMGGDGIESGAYEKALEWAYEGVCQWEWWESALECLLDQVKEKFGITVNPKDVQFDLERGSFVSFGKTHEVDDRKILRLAGIDLRTKIARTIIDDGLVIGVNHGYGGSYDWIGYASYEGWPSYIPDDVADKIKEVLRDAHDLVLTGLRDEWEYLTGAEHLREVAQMNDALFNGRGYHA